MVAMLLCSNLHSANGCSECSIGHTQNVNAKMMPEVHRMLNPSPNENRNSFSEKRAAWSVIMPLT